jgi:hypothetical protein
MILPEKVKNQHKEFETIPLIHCFNISFFKDENYLKK